MAQPNVADFVTFSDSSFDLTLSGTNSRSLAESVFGPESGEGAIIMYNRRREAAGSVSYEVRLNGTVVSNASVRERDWHTVHEVVRTATVEHGTNEIEFVVTAGSGRLSIGDVTLLYRRSPAFVAG